MPPSHNLSARGLNLVKSFEGLSLKAYWLKGEKYPTIGYGHTGPDVRDGQRISRYTANILLERDVRWAVDTVNRRVAVQVNQNQFDAMVSLCFNIGEGAFTDSTVLKLVNARKFRRAALWFGRWTRDSTGGISRGLVARRAKEAALFVRSLPVRSP